MEDRMEAVRGLAGKIKEKYWPPGKDQLLILVLVGLLLAVIAIPVEKKGTEDGISGETGMDSGMMGNSSASGNSSVNDNLGSDMSGGEDEPLSDLEKYEIQTEQKLEELTLKIEDVETLLDDVSDVAYDKAVEVVTDTVRQETHKEDIRLIEETKKWVLSPERKAPQKERDYAAARLDGVITKIKRVMQSALAKIQKTLMQPEVKKAGKEQIKEKARESIRDKLAKDKLDADRDNRERWEREGRIAPTKKHDMEL